LDSAQTTKSKKIICPICKENCRMCIINYKIILFECKNGHKTNNILLKEFDNKQQINEYLITCDVCDYENKGSSHENKFYQCLTCKKKLGVLCKEKHKKEEHNIIEYDKKDYYCEIHNDYFYSYCQECRLDICMNCFSDHKDHNIIEYQKIIPKKEKVNEELVELRKKIDQINQFMNEINEKFNIVKENMERFYQINYDILNNYHLQDKNYQLLQNINEINNNIKLSNIDKIINEKNTSIKIAEILKAYEEMITKEENHDIFQKEEIGNKAHEKKKEKEKDKKEKEKELIKTDLKRLKTINVCPNSDQKIKTFPGKNLETNVNEKNKKPSNKIVNDFQRNKTRRQSAKQIGSSLKKLKEDEKLGPNEIILEYKKVSLRDKIIKIFGEKFVSNNSSNCSIIFDDKTLELKEKLEIPKNYKNEEIIKIKLIANNLTDMSYMFHDCTLLTSIGNNSTLDTSNVTNMSYMFYNCKILTNLFCISKWVTSNVENISHMFNSCLSLKELPDIFKWDTAKVTTLDSLFNDCISLSSLPDISKWDVSSVTTINNLFANCQLLISLPDISKWNTSNITHMNNLFADCYSLISLPDISKWNTSNVTHMNNIFSSCKKLKCIPDISSWDISKVEFKYNMFEGCTSLKNIPSKFK
jgi:surface protein